MIKIKSYKMSHLFHSLSDKNIDNHVNIYNSYVEDFNNISAQLDSADRSNVNSNNSAYRCMKADETYNMNSTYLHELYFSNIADQSSQIKMDSISYMRLNRDFGTFDNWQRDFIANALSARCGWAVTYFNFYTQSYLKDSKTYLKAMMKQLRWPIIEKRFKKADKLLQIIRGS